jgi:metal-responsive CopG/Arc/MetJ family transcriptional regulator
METIQVSFDEALLAEMQQATSALQMTPSDFIKVAVERAIRQREKIALERRDAQGYAKHPQTPEEIEEWESVQA